MSNNLIADLEEFTREMAKHDERQAVVAKPAVVSVDVRELRVSLIEEEILETIEAIYTPTSLHTESEQASMLADIADGIADSIVVLIGTALAYGIPLQKVWDEVHRSNMDKVTKLCFNCHGGKLLDGSVYCQFCNNTGRVPITPRKREDGKILKPEGWVGPDIKSIIEEAMK